MKKIIVIGGGFAGLGTAAILAKQGFEVTLLEKNSLLGGRAMVKREDGFTFDLGPSWYQMPEFFQRYFGLFGKKPTDYYQLEKLDPHYRVFFGEARNGEVDAVDMVDDLEKNLSYFESLEPGSAKKVQEFLKNAEYQYNVACQRFLYTSYDKLSDFLNPKLLVEGAKMRLYESLDKHVSRYVKNGRIKQILEYACVFLGGSPKNMPAMFSLINYVDFCQGVYYPVGGFGKVIDALESLCKENNVEIKTNSEVTSILVEEGRAKNVVLQSGEVLTADIVVSAADYAHTETKLLDEKWQTYPETYWKKKTLAPSAFILYLGIKGRVKNLLHHNLFFDEDWTLHFDEVFENPKWPTKPHYYVCCPSKTDPSVAPIGDENLFILIPTAAGLDDTEEIRKKYRDMAIVHLEKITGDTISSRIVYEEIMSQRDYISLYNARDGTALGLAHTLFQSAMFRPKIKSKKVSNLYYAGQFTLPGIGTPMCLVSAEIVGKRILQENPS